MTKSALVTGATGQDGRYLVTLLHDRGCRVFGQIRAASLQWWPLDVAAFLPQPMVAEG